MPSQTIKELSRKHPKLVYESFSINSSANSITLTYKFFLEPNIYFSPQISIPSSKSGCDQIAERFVFLIGLVELISYWKLSCPPDIEIRCGYLSEDEIRWWKELYQKGLGEFFYVNQISPDIELNFNIATPKQQTPTILGTDKRDGAIILVGGGKDSIVSLDAARSWPDMPLKALCVNPIEASLNAISEANYPTPLVVNRTLDPQLKILNQAGYLNGHTPYSALLAFVSSLVGYQNNFRYVLASNETSASEGNAFINGIEINHQYSKSFQFESLFRDYPFGFAAPVEYLSLLRPLNELQICAIFAQLKNYHSLFRSCNREQTQKAREKELSKKDAATSRRTGWCGECPKCVFTCIALACFLSPSEITTIFGIFPLDSPGFIEIASQLAGYGEHKPFECVGTYEEVRSALAHIAKKFAVYPEYMSIMNQLKNLAGLDAVPIKTILSGWDEQNYLPAQMEHILRARLFSAMEGLIQ